MVRPSEHKHIRTEAFDKVHKALNTVHHVKQVDWDLHVLAVLWAYRIVYKTLTTWAPPKLKYEANAVIPMEHEKPSPCIVTPVDTMVRGAWKEGIR